MKLTRVALTGWFVAILGGLSLFGFGLPLDLVTELSQNLSNALFDVVDSGFAIYNVLVGAFLILLNKLTDGAKMILNWIKDLIGF